MGATTEILQDLLQALRRSGPFATVSLGGEDGQAAVPRASVEPVGQDVFGPDDSPDGRWVRLRARVVIRTRSQGPAEAVARIGDLCEAAVAAVLADPHRGGRCRDLPIGRATEVDRVEVRTPLRLPDVEGSFLVRCHLET